MFLDKKILDFIKNCKNRKLDITITTVVETFGSTYAKVGNMMLVNSQNEFTGVLGSSFLQNKILELSKISLEKKEINFFESIAKDESTGHGTSKYKVEPFFMMKIIKI